MSLSSLLSHLSSLQKNQLLTLELRDENDGIEDDEWMVRNWKWCEII